MYKNVHSSNIHNSQKLGTISVHQLMNGGVIHMIEYRLAIKGNEVLIHAKVLAFTYYMK